MYKISKKIKKQKKLATTHKINHAWGMPRLSAHKKQKLEMVSRKTSKLTEQNLLEHVEGTKNKVLHTKNIVVTHLYVSI